MVSILVTGFRSTKDIALNAPFASSWQSMSFFRISGANAWNRLPDSIREGRSYSGFKFALRRKILVTAVTNRECVSKIL